MLALAGGAGGTARLASGQPMMYFGGVRGRPAYCASHVVPLESLPSDLASAATTPNFAWVSPEDCSDMGGCGIRAAMISSPGNSA